MNRGSLKLEATALPSVQQVKIIRPRFLENYNLASVQALAKASKSVTANHYCPGASPVKILQRKFYAMLIFKHPDWMIHLSSQSECLKISVA